LQRLIDQYILPSREIQVFSLWSPYLPNPLIDPYAPKWFSRL
jgi:hypothetical protein